MKFRIIFQEIISLKIVNIHSFIAKQIFSTELWTIIFYYPLFFQPSLQLKKKNRMLHQSNIANNTKDTKTTANCL